MKIPRWREGGYWTIPDEFRSRSRLLDFLKKHLNPVSFCAQMTAGQTINRDTATTVQFDTETYAGTGYDTSNYTFRAPYAGKYFFYTSITWENIAATIDLHAISFLHNSQTLYVQADNRNSGKGLYAPNSYWTDNGSIILDLNKGDTVLVQAYYQDTTPVATEQIQGSTTASDRYTMFMGYKL